MRVRVFKGILWFLSGIAIPVAIMRFVHGLGATTNLIDTTPWGFWIGFDVLGGVALAAGGFLIAATVHIFHLKEYKPILRPAVLTAFLGYGLVAVALLFDLGLPWHIWMPTVNWQDHSALFEVAWCVMLYLTVLALEFLPVVLEKTPFNGILNILRKVTLPLVILGIMLSTLHQSSLGTLFLIMPFRLHPLWYSKFLPLLFFVSAIGLGLVMVMSESLFSSWLYKRKPEWNLLEKLGRAAGITLLIYFIIRIIDLANSGVLNSKNLISWEGSLFLFELLLSVFLPVILFLIPATRKSKAVLAIVAPLTVVGIVLYRIDVGGIATISATKSTYVPSWMELAISIGLVSAAALVFIFFVENFKVYEETAKEAMDSNCLFCDQLSNVRLGEPWSGSLQIYSLILIFAIAIGFFLLPSEALYGAKPLPSPVQNARLVEATIKNIPNSPEHLFNLAVLNGHNSQDTTDMFLIDGNRNGNYVLFNHQAHIEKQGQKDSCRKCHHLNKPLNWATPCYQCHRDMYEPTDTFDHSFHIKKLGNNHACTQCHSKNDMTHSARTATSCLECHAKMLANSPIIPAPKKNGARFAPGYKTAMHQLCITCHKSEEKKNKIWKNQLSLCTRCHQKAALNNLQPWLPSSIAGK